MCCMVYGDVWLYAALLLYWLYCCIATQWARDHATLLYCLIQHVFVLYCCRARCIGFTPAQASRHGCAAVRLDDMPEELRGCCAHALDTSAGCFGQVNKSCKELVEGRLAEEKEAHEAPYRKRSPRATARRCAALGSPTDPNSSRFPTVAQRSSSVLAWKRSSRSGAQFHQPRRTPGSWRPAGTGITGALSTSMASGRRPISRLSGWL